MGQIHIARSGALVDFRRRMDAVMGLYVRIGDESRMVLRELAKAS